MSSASFCNNGLPLSACNTSFTSRPPIEMTPPRSAQCESKKKQRARVVLFIDALINYTSRYAPECTLPVKGIIRYCIIRNRGGDLSYSPLSNALMVNVRKSVGEFHWSRIVSYYKFHIAEKRRQAKENRSLQQQEQLQQQQQQSLKASLSQPQFSLTMALGMLGFPSKTIATNSTVIRSPCIQSGSIDIQGW